ncbi:magnesium/cobalt transporter CorA [Pirellulimonas nuda]|uniref:magnesium/cobalt transporter CorA n=1 Tax=Pirellulimonas nuda TaxID=2528009 RepID=UPI0018D3007E|nr:magnesium/cobalt transporter CorA [Pirellulimonas nuda]
MRKLFRRPRIRRKALPGAPPEQVSVEDVQPCSLEVFQFNQGSCTRFHPETVEEVKPLLGEGKTVWVNVDGLGDLPVIRQLAKLFGIHPLAVEDIVNVHQRSKIDAYEGLLYIVARMVRPSGPFLTEQVSLCLGDGFLVTFLEDPGDVFDSVRSQLKQRGSFLRKHPTADVLAYRLIDASVDSYYPLLEALGDRLDGLEEQLTGSPARDFIAEVHHLRAEMLLARRAIWPHREMVNSMLRDANPLVSDTTRTFLRDVYDHTVHLIDHVETYRELCSDVRDQYMTAVSNRLNEIMKVLTVISTIFLPLSFIASLYGMNFNTEKSGWNMPELSWRFGYPFVLGVMSVIAAGMLWKFFRMGWLTTSDGSVEGGEQNGS